MLFVLPCYCSKSYLKYFQWYPDAATRGRKLCRMRGKWGTFTSNFFLILICSYSFGFPFSKCFYVNFIPVASAAVVLVVASAAVCLLFYLLFIILAMRPRIRTERKAIATTKTSSRRNYKSICLFIHFDKQGYQIICGNNLQFTGISNWYTLEVFLL